MAAWFLFTVQFTRPDQWIGRTKRGMLLVSIVPALALLLAWTNERHGLIWSATHLATATPIPALVVSHGAGFWLLWGFDYWLLLVGTLWLVSMSARASGLLQRQALALLIGIVPVWIANALYISHWGPAPWLDLTPYAIAITGIVYAWSLLHLHLLNVIPVARSAVFAFIEDAIVVVDLHNRIVDVNPAAQQLAPQQTAPLKGKPLAALLGDQAERMDAGAPLDEGALGDIRLAHAGVERVFELRASALHDADQGPLGRVYVLRDITKRKRAEEALQQLTHSLEARVAERTRELYYQANLLEHMSDAVISVDATLGIISWNKAAERIYGYQLAEVKGRQIGEVIPTTLAHATPAEAIDLVAADGYWEGEAVQRRADGSPITVWVSASAVKDETGRILGAVAVNRDMSGIREIQRALQESEARYREILESTRELIFSVDAGGRFLFVNRAWRETLGYREDQVAELTIGDIAHPQERAYVQRLYRRLQAGEGPLPVDTVLKTGEGQPLFVDGLATAVFHDGEFVAAHTFLRDITRGIQAEAAHQAAEQRYRSLFEDAPGMYVLAQLEQDRLTIVDCNALCVQTLGYERDQLIGKPFADLLAPGATKSLQLDMRGHTGSNLFRGQECAVVTRGGRVIETLLRTHYERDAAGDVRGVRAMFVDISDRKRMERQLQESTDRLHALGRHLESVREEEQTRIAREVHDELGQILTVLKMDVSWLQRHVQSPAPGDGAAVPRKLAAMSEQLSATIQTVHRIAAELRPALLDDLGLLAAIEWLTRNYEERTGVACSFVHSGDGAELLDKDLVTTLFRICQEALTNVARHAHASVVRVCLDVTEFDIKLEITDDGIGIAQAQIADPRSFGLLGMRERLYPWNGRMTVTGAPQHGTTLAIVIQLQQAARKFS